MAAIINKDLIFEEEAIEDFLNLDEEESKLVALLKDEFHDFSFFNYGKIVYLQQDLDLETFPHISEILETRKNLYQYYLGIVLTHHYSLM